MVNAEYFIYISIKYLEYMFILFTNVYNINQPYHEKIAIAISVPVHCLQDINFTPIVSALRPNCRLQGFIGVLAPPPTTRYKSRGGRSSTVLRSERRPVDLQGRDR